MSNILEGGGGGDYTSTYIHIHIWLSVVFLIRAYVLRLLKSDIVIKVCEHSGETTNINKCMHIILGDICECETFVDATSPTNVTHKRHITLYKHLCISILEIILLLF